MSTLQTDALIIGGGPGGMSAAISAKQHWPDKRILLVRKETDAIVPCGIPYIFGTLDDVDKDLVSTAPFTQLGGEILIDEVTHIDREQKIANLSSGDSIEWQKLILATGASAFIPPIPGADRQGVFTIEKNHDVLENFFDELLPNIQRLIIIGGGFIGVEFADEIHKRGIDITIVEMLPHVMMRNFDPPICERVQNTLEQQGIRCLTGKRVAEILGGQGSGPVNAIKLADGEILETDAVLIAIGDQRRLELARKMSLTLARGGGVWVDAYQRSRDDADVFAVGDCAFKQDFFFRRSIPSLLASTAAAEGRIAGMNLFGLRAERTHAGSIAIYASQVNDLAFGCAGLTARAAQEEGMEIIIGSTRVPDHHPPTMPGTQIMDCYLIFSHSGHLIGGQVMGGATTAEVVNAIGIAIQARLTAADLVSFQFGSHPRLTAPAHPIVLASNDALIHTTYPEHNRLS